MQKRVRHVLSVGVLYVYQILLSGVMSEGWFVSIPNFIFMCVNGVLDFIF